jgi:hypothetical protein
MQDSQVRQGDARGFVEVGSWQTTWDAPSGPRQLNTEGGATRGEVVAARCDGLSKWPVPLTSFFAPRAASDASTRAGSIRRARRSHANLHRQPAAHARTATRPVPVMDFVVGQKFAWWCFGSPRVCAARACGPFSHCPQPTYPRFLALVGSPSSLTLVFALMLSR